jgi:glycosyltransferase involved in cell wall biosynthesis
MDMEAAWQNIKVLLVPSLWFEAWGIVVVEAHLRGIPVISSDAGALSESMIYLDYIVPVNHIRGERDEEGNYTIPEQNVQPWVETLNKLMSDRAEYERVSDKVRTTTEHWLRDMDPNAVENWLTDMALRAKRMEI